MKATSVLGVIHHSAQKVGCVYIGAWHPIIKVMQHTGEWTILQKGQMNDTHHNWFIYLISTN